MYPYRHIACILCVLFLWGCNSQIIFEETRSINSPWDYGDVISFQLPVQDTVQYYDLVLQLRHNSEFSYENMYTRIETIFPNGRKTEDVSSFQLAKKNGVWIGECQGSHCHLDFDLKKHFRFQEIGEHTISFENYSREALEGIESLSLSLVLSEDKKQ